MALMDIRGTVLSSFVTEVGGSHIQSFYYFTVNSSAHSH